MPARRRDSTTSALPRRRTIEAADMPVISAKTDPMSQKTWGGRFSGATDNRVETFTESISFDQRLYRHDVLASQAHARMLAEVGLITVEEAAKIVAALEEIRGEIERSEFEFSIKLEDIHT